MTVRLSLSGLIYQRECVQRAILDYRDLCSIEITEFTPMGCVIEVRTELHNDLREDRLVDEFLNYLLDLSTEHYLVSS